MSNAQRSAASCDWGTPPEVAAAVRECLGGIAFDPCSSAKHNEVVMAQVYLTEGGLDADWDQERVFCNPPGSARGVQQWWAKFNTVQSGIWLGFNMNQLAYLSPSPLGLYGTPWIFIPRKRLRFIGAGNNPPHNSYLFGFGCRGRALREAIPGTLRYL